MMAEGRSMLRVRQSSRDGPSPPKYTQYQEPVLSQQEMFELKRQEELRRQIKIKERELKEMSMKSIDNNPNRYSFGGGESQPNFTPSAQSHNLRSGSKSRIVKNSSRGPRRSGHSPLRGSRDGSRDGSHINRFVPSYTQSGNQGGYVQDQPDETAKITITSNQSVSKASAKSRPPIPHNNHYMGERSSNSPSLRKKSFGSRSPTRDIDLRDASYGLLTGGPSDFHQQQMANPVLSASGEYIAQLQTDNASLEKRLNLVLNELDRVNRDRSTIVQKLSSAEQEVKMMRQQLGNEDASDHVNNEIQLNLNGQRDLNVQVKVHISETDISRTEAIQRLRTLQGERDRRAHMVEELQDDLQKKMQLCKQLETEQYQAHERIHELEEQLGVLNRQAHVEGEQIDDTQRIRDKLGQERDELHVKLEKLSRTYENCVNEIGRERTQMQGHNRHHNKLLVAKVTFCLLEQMLRRRKQEAVNEFFQYCKFDTRCHRTLKQFAANIDRLGKYRLKIAIKQWYQNTFKPVEAQLQEEDLCLAFRRRKLLSRMFNLWRWRHQNNDEIDGVKNKALTTIWNLKLRDCTRDVQRAFSIWRDKLNYQKFRKQRCKKLIWKQYSNRLAQAVEKWIQHNQNVQQQMRLHVLAREFAETQQKRIMFAEMRFVLFDMRRKRLNRLRTYVKAWKESNQYRRFMLAASLSVLGFKKECNQSTLKMCFDALRNSKEQEKVMLMDEALGSDCSPAIETLNKEIVHKTQTAVRSGRNRGLNAIKAMVLRQVAEYFNKWKGAQQRHNVVVSQNLKDTLIRLWYNLERDAFHLWKKGKGNKEIVKQQMEMIELQEEGSNMAAAVEELNKEIKIEKAKVDRSGRQSLSRGTRIMKNRYLKQYMERWAAVNRLYKSQQGGSEAVLKKIKKRMFKQAFDRYKANCARQQLDERNEGSSEQLRRTLNVRELRKCFNAMRSYNSKNVKARTYMKILLGKMDHWTKKRAFGMWQDGGNVMKMEDLQFEQNALTEEMTVKNAELGTLATKVADKSARNAQLTETLKKSGQRSLSNAFARAYFKRTARAFEVWKNWASCDDHKKRIIKRTLAHWKAWNGKFLLSVMEKWKALSNIQDTRNKIASLEQQMGDAEIVRSGNTQEYQKQKADLQQRNREVDHEFDVALARRSKLLVYMTDKNQDCHFQGRLRCIFLSWAAHTKRVVHFTRCIKNVVTKSMWDRGFQNINAFSRDKALTRSQNKSLSKLRLMFWRRNCGAALSRWKGHEYENTLEIIEMVDSQQQGIKEDHFEKKQAIQQQNITRSAKIVSKNQKQKWLNAWRNVNRWLKHKRISTEDLLQAKSSYASMRLIKKWRARTEMTVSCRAAYAQFQAKRELIYKKACYRELMAKHHRDKALVLKLSNLARGYDNRALQSAFQMIQNYWTTKKNVHSHERNVSSRTLGDCLNKIYHRKLLGHYVHLRRQILGNKVVEGKKKLFFAHFISQSTRDAFMRWKKKALYEQTVLDVNEIGPVVEEVLDAQMQVMNLKNLMADEGFTDYQVEDSANNADKKARELMARAIARMKHCNGDDYLKPKMFDRWRAWVKMRKIVKHWLGYLSNRQQHRKADLSFCFLKWKHFFADKQNHLQRRTRAQLKNRACQAAKRLEVLADTTQQDEDLINHISDQNEELFVNYRKSQRLALALGRDNLKMGMMHGFKLMMESAHYDRRRQLEAILQRNINVIATTKDKIQEIEGDNESLANENEELRQFSLDGYQLGRNVQSLTNEREQLSVDLADKAEMIKKLLDENERLSVRLRQAQAYGAVHINQSL